MSLLLIVIRSFTSGASSVSNTLFVLKCGGGKESRVFRENIFCWGLKIIKPTNQKINRYKTIASKHTRTEGFKLHFFSA